MNHKVGKFKLWQLILVGVVIGGALYLYKRQHTQNLNPEEVVGGTGTGAFGPIDPNTGIPFAFEGGAGTAGAAGESLSDFLGKVGELREAGFFGTPEREPGETVVIHDEPASRAELKHAREAAAKARAAARAANKKLHESQTHHKNADHKHTQKPKTTGDAASVPHIHVAPAHPLTRAKHRTRH